MKVSTAQPFQLIYSLYEHEYLGYLFESFVIQLDEKGRLTLAHQNISSKNAREFASGLDDNDYELIKLMDQMQQESIVLKFYKKKIKPAEFFFKVYDKERGDKGLQETIHQFLEHKRARILGLLKGKMIFEMGRDGEPAWRRIHWQEEKATVLFHFRRNEDNTHYFPTIKHAGEKLEWQYNGSFLVCHEPAWLIVNDRLFSFAKGVDGHKLKPFLNKKFIVIPKKSEQTYFEKFVTKLVASFDVYAKALRLTLSVIRSYPSWSLQSWPPAMLRYPTFLATTMGLARKVMKMPKYSSSSFFDMVLTASHTNKMPVAQSSLRRKRMITFSIR